MSFVPDYSALSGARVSIGRHGRATEIRTSGYTVSRELLSHRRMFMFTLGETKG